MLLQRTLLVISLVLLANISGASVICSKFSSNDYQDGYICEDYQANESKSDPKSSLLKLPKAIGPKPLVIWIAKELTKEAVILYLESQVKKKVQIVPVVLQSH